MKLFAQLLSLLPWMSSAEVPLQDQQHEDHRAAMQTFLAGIRADEDGCTMNGLPLTVYVSPYLEEIVHQEFPRLLSHGPFNSFIPCVVCGRADRPTYGEPPACSRCYSEG